MKRSRRSASLALTAAEGEGVVPFNWIVGVHVWTALVGHLVIGRALFARRRVVATAHA